MNIEELKKRAAASDAEAMCELGKAYECGRDVVVNLWEAVKWYRLAAEQGCAEAQWRLGQACFFGVLAEQDYQEALKWYRLAAEQGHKYAKKKVLEVERRIEKEKKENARYSKQYLDSCIKSYNAGDKEM